MAGSINDVVRYEAVEGSSSLWRFSFAARDVRIISPDEGEREFAGSDDDLVAVAAKWRVALLTLKRMEGVMRVVVHPQDVLVEVNAYKMQLRLLLTRISVPLYAAIVEDLRLAYKAPLPSERYSSANLAHAAQMERARARARTRRPLQVRHGNRGLG